MEIPLGQESPKILEIRARSQKRRKLLNQQVCYEMWKRYNVTFLLFYSIIITVF